MARRKKPGPKTPWQKRVRYNRARCIERLKPCQIEALSSADAFASRLATPLNGYLTIKFSEFGHPLKEFQAGTKRLSEWHRRWGGELRWIYVWEAIGGHHIHALAHIPRRAWFDFRDAVASAFVGHDALLRPRTFGQDAMAYLCKGTDLQTHWTLRGSSRVRARKQGLITWKRCGWSENIGARAQATVEQNNCVEACTSCLRKGEQQQSPAHVTGRSNAGTTTLVVSKQPLSCLETVVSAGHTATEAPPLKTIQQPE